MNVATQGIAALKSDLATGVGSDTPGGWFQAALTVRFFAVFLFRVSQSAGSVNSVLGACVKQLNHLLTGADIAWQATVGPGLQLYHPTGVVIGPHVILGPGAVLQQGVTLGGLGGPDGGITSSPTIGARVHIGAGGRVFGAIAIGDDVNVGANAVVTKSVPDGKTVVGIPARVLD